MVDSSTNAKIMISSEMITHPIRVFDMVLEYPKVIILVPKSHRNIPVIIGNTWSTSVDLTVDKNV